MQELMKASHRLTYVDDTFKLIKMQKEFSSTLPTVYLTTSNLRKFPDAEKNKI